MSEIFFIFHLLQSEEVRTSEVLYEKYTFSDSQTAPCIRFCAGKIEMLPKLLKLIKPPL